MRMRAVVVGVVGTLLAIVTPSTSTAHPSGDFYVGRWFGSAVDYWFSSAVPSGAFRDRVENGEGKWGALPPSLHFVRARTWSGTIPCFNCCANPGDNVVRYPSIDGVGGVYAETRICHPGNIMEEFQLRFDSGQNWYTGTGSPPSDEADVIGIAAHEFGHAGGWGPHFSETSTQCPSTNSTRHTMCPGSEYYGEKWLRSLEPHDEHTFDDAYP